MTLLWSGWPSSSYAALHRRRRGRISKTTHDNNNVYHGCCSSKSSSASSLSSSSSPIRIGLVQPETGDVRQLTLQPGVPFQTVLLAINGVLNNRLLSTSLSFAFFLSKKGHHYQKTPIRLEPDDSIYGIIEDGDRIYVESSSTTTNRMGNQGSSIMNDTNDQDDDMCVWKDEDNDNDERKRPPPFAPTARTPEYAASVYDTPWTPSASTRYETWTNRYTKTHTDDWMPLTDLSGEVVTQGTVSQYTFQRGESACTSICLLVAHKLLQQQQQQQSVPAASNDTDNDAAPPRWKIPSLDSVTTRELDDWIQQGIFLHLSHSMHHASLSDLYDMPLYNDCCQGICRGPVFHGHLVPSKQDGQRQHLHLSTNDEPFGLATCVQQALRYARDKKATRVLIVLTKPPETVLCILDHCDADDNNNDNDNHDQDTAAAPSCYLFDSHGQSHQTNKTAYLKKFRSTTELVTSLDSKYASASAAITSSSTSSFSPSLQEDMYNMFEATFLVAINDDDDDESDSKPPALADISAPTNQHQRHEKDAKLLAAVPDFLAKNSNETKESDRKLLPPALEEQTKAESRKPAPIPSGQEQVVCTNEKVSSAARSTPGEEGPRLKQHRDDDRHDKDAKLPDFFAKSSNKTNESDRKLPPPALEEQTNAESRKPAPIPSGQEQVVCTNEKGAYLKPPPVAATNEASNDAPDVVMVDESDAGDEKKSHDCNPSPRWDNLIDEDDFRCPITYEVMADPVTCDDGNTYERSNIQKHFEQRIKDEEERRRQQENPDDQRSNDDNTTCCGARNRPIELTSPLTQEVVTNRLVPNRAIEKQIVRLMDKNALQMTAEDVADWHKRRDEKRQQDQLRAEYERQQREKQETMRKNAEEAERRRAAEAEQEANTVPAEAATRVRLERRMQQNELLSPNDLGLSVSLAQESDRIPLSIAKNSQYGSRCMVTCCRKRLIDKTTGRESFNWCRRCGRVACTDCLDFTVTDIAAPSHLKDLFMICGECVMHIVDVLDPSNLEMRQVRAIVSRYHLSRYMTVNRNRVCELKAIAAGLEAREEFGPSIRKLRSDMDDLNRQHRALQRKIGESKKRAQRARNDDANVDDDYDSVDNNRVEEWEQICTQLNVEYCELLEKGPESDDPDEQIRFIEKVSDVTHRLNQAQASYAEALSTAELGRSKAKARRPKAATTGATKVSELESKCQDLRREYERLCTNAPDGSDENEMYNYILLKSQVEDTLGRTEFELAMALSSMDEEAETLNEPFSSSPLSSSKSLLEEKGKLYGLSSLVQFQARLEEISKENTKWMNFFFQPMDEKQKKHSATLARSLRESINTIIEMHEEENYEYLESAIDHAIELMDRIASEVRNINGDDVKLRKAAVRELNGKVEWISNQKMEDTGALGSIPDGCLGKRTVDDAVIELRKLQSADKASLMENDLVEQSTRVSELKALLQGANASTLRGQLSKFLDDAVLEKEDWEAFGTQDDWPLPLDLKYPTEKMNLELDSIRNKAELRATHVQRFLDKTYELERKTLQREKEDLEDLVGRARSELQDAQATAEAEAKLARERAEARRREEAERRRREEERLERERRAREEADRLRRANEAAEQATRDAFANAAQRRGQDNATMFGGRGDLRMCGRCKAGPFENKACANLETHNDTSTTYNGSTVASTTKPNACPNCGWFHADWHQWPLWDGVHGPH